MGEGGSVDPDRHGDAFEEGRGPISWIDQSFYERYAKACPGDVGISATRRVEGDLRDHRSHPPPRR
jgi:hypothetical protein